MAVVSPGKDTNNHRPRTPTLRTQLEDKDAFVQQVLVAVRHRLASSATPSGQETAAASAVRASRGHIRPPDRDVDPIDPIAGYSDDAAWWQRPEHKLVDVTISSGALEGWVGARERTIRPNGKALPAVETLASWAGDVQSPSLLTAVLGDLGTGKTTTMKLLTDELLDRRERSGPDAEPLPILFDLRRMTVEQYRRSPNLRGVIEALLDAETTAGHRPSVEAVLDAISSGGCLVIFDGLDEILVHLSGREGQEFTRHLLESTRTFWQPTRRRPAASAGLRPSKLLVTCRTHYFRDVKDETAHLTAQDRGGPVKDAWQLLFMLPFTEAQIRDYLAANLAGADVDRLMDLLAGVHDLRGMAERPLTLMMISEELEYVEQAKLAGATVRPVDLYAAMTDRWLARDSGKHTLLPEHKQELMEHLAAELWRHGRRSWSAAHQDQWVVDFLAARPDMRRHYPNEMKPDLWKEDLRTASFVSRRGDDEFTFGHSSLHEYFLARYLAAALALGPDKVDTVRELWAMPVPSRETLDFLGQLGATTPESARVARETLTALNGRYAAQASELALAYALAAADNGHPHQPLAGAHLSDAQLAGWTIGSPRRRTDLSRAHLERADLSRARLTNASLAGSQLVQADLSHALIRGSTFSDADLTGATLTGTTFRECQLDAMGITSAHTYRTAALRCQAAPERPGWLIAPRADPPLPVGTMLPFTGHTGWVLAVAYAPDGTRLASGSDGEVRIWDAATGQPIHTLTGHTGGVWAVAYAPDGTRLASGSGDGTVRIWDAATGQPIHTLTGHTGGVWAVAYAPDGTRLASGSEDGTVRIWDAATGQPIHTLTGHTGLVRAVAYAPDGTRLASGSGDGTVRIWDAATGQPIHTLTGHTGLVRAVAYAPDGTRLASGSGDGTVRIWDAATGQPIHTLTGHTGLVRAVAYAPDGTRLASGSEDGTVRIWDAATGQPIHTLTGHTGRVWAVAYAPDGTRLASGSDGEVRIWDAATGQPIHTLTGHTGGVWAVAYAPDGTRLASGSRDGTVRIWDAATGQPIHTLTGHTGGVWAVAYAPDGTRLASGSEDGTVRIWDAATGQPIHTLTGHTGGVWAVAYAPDGTRLASGSGDGTVRIWDAATGQPIHTLTGHTGGVWAVAYAPDGTRLASGSEDGTVRIWDAATGQPIHTLTGHTGGVWAVAYAPDGTRLASGSDGEVRIWDAATGQPIHTLTGHTGGVWAVAYAPDGTRLASGSDGEVRIWDAATGQPIHTLTGHTGGVWAVAYAPDGTRLASGSRDGTVRIWDAATGEPDGIRLHYLGDGETAVFDADGTLIGASEESWQWLGWNAIVDGQITRLPAETYGPLPPLRTAPTDHPKEAHR
ncbi:MAG: pentapeptide repeat-containing protein [Tetrasphaera sp.]